MDKVGRPDGQKIVPLGFNACMDILPGTKFKHYTEYTHGCFFFFSELENIFDKQC